jgi:hypothetical protein
MCWIKTKNIWNCILHKFSAFSLSLLMGRKGKIEFICEYGLYNNIRAEKKWYKKAKMGFCFCFYSHSSTRIMPLSFNMSYDIYMKICKKDCAARCGKSIYDGRENAWGKYEFERIFCIPFVVEMWIKWDKRFLSLFPPLFAPTKNYSLDIHLHGRTKIFSLHS